MATKTTCDVCGYEIHDPIKITVYDGEHPHNGSTMYDVIDTCPDCILKLSKKYDIKINEEKDKICK